jgi:thiol:disulfide interchange protein DsbC
MKQILDKRKDIAFYIKLFPLPMHQEAYGKSKAIVCDKDPLALLEAAFERKQIPQADCEKAKVIDENIALAQKLGINSTPTIILPDGVLVPGAVEPDALIRMIDKQ